MLLLQESMMKNVNIWENDIQGLCSMIQDYITQYTYYETINMEYLQKNWNNR